MYKKSVLDNGLRIITYDIPHMHSVSLGIWLNVGGRYEDEENKGIAHVLEHLVFKGTKKFSARQIKESIEGIGGSLNGFTSEEFTCYLVKVPSKYLELSLDILSDMVINPTLDKVELEKERLVIIEEIKMYKDLPQVYVHELLDELLWPANSLGMNLAGTIESVSRITASDMLDFKEKFYASSNIVIAACGQLEHKAILDKATQIFALNSKGKENSFIPYSTKQTMPQVKLLTKQTEQTHLAIGFHGLKREDPCRHVLGLLNVILGANMSSRLFNEVREKRGLAYEIGTQVKRFKETGAFVIHAGMDNQKTLETVEVILKELKKIKNEPPDVDEFRRAKEFYTGQLALALEETVDHMLWIGESTIALNKTYTLEDILKEVDRIDIPDLLQLANRIFGSNCFNLALIGPQIEKDRERINQIIPYLN